MKPKQHNSKITHNVANTSAGSLKSAEQCVKDSSYPDGQCDFPSHHTLAFTHASNSGHLNSQSAENGTIRTKEFTEYHKTMYQVDLDAVVAPFPST